MHWRRNFALAFILLAMLISLAGDGIPQERAFDMWVATLAAGRQFNLAGWVAVGLAEKVATLVTQPARGLDATRAGDLVRAYLHEAQRVGQLEDQLTVILSEGDQPAQRDERVALLDELAQLRQEQAARRPQVEAILEGQISAVLAAEGLTAVGVVWPPVKFRFSEPPLYLVISPRQVIALRTGLHLRPDMNVAQREQVENTVDSQLDVSSLVEETGGFGAYPTMVLDRSGLDWILSTIAHEWVHNYLVFHALGRHYFDNPQTVTLNETVASIIGDEIGEKALATYYPRPASPSPVPPAATDGGSTRAASAFDYSATMRETRLQADALLAAGKVREAEEYMEAQRKVFRAQGYALRKLNQAFFAFHGSYATGASAVDPIGPKLTRLRQASPSLQAFVATVRTFRSLADLDRALANLDRAP